MIYLCCMVKEYTHEQIKSILNKYKSVRLNDIEVKAKLPTTKLNKFLEGKQNLSDKQFNSLVRVLIKKELI